MVIDFGIVNFGEFGVLPFIPTLTEILQSIRSLQLHIPLHFNADIWSSLLQIIVEVLLYIVPIWCEDNYCIIDTSSALICLQAICWSLLLINDQFIRWQHRRLTKTGHLLFYRKTQVLKHGALYVFSLGNFIINGWLLYDWGSEGGKMKNNWNVVHFKCRYRKFVSLITRCNFSRILC